MSKGLQWTLGISAVLITLAVIASTLLPFFFPQAGWSGYGMPPALAPGASAGPEHMYGGGTMMGGLGMFGVGMFLLPLLFVGLVVVGIVWLIKSGATPTVLQPPVAASTFCTHCGKPLQTGWKACPYCGEKIP